MDESNPTKRDFIMFVICVAVIVVYAIAYYKFLHYLSCQTVE